MVLPESEHQPETPLRERLGRVTVPLSHCAIAHVPSRAYLPSSDQRADLGSAPEREEGPELYFQSL